MVEYNEDSYNFNIFSEEYTPNNVYETLGTKYCKDLAFIFISFLLLDKVNHYNVKTYEVIRIVIRIIN